MPLAIIVDWIGPFESFDSFAAEVKENWHDKSKCIYMASGSHNTYNYVGLTSKPSGRFTNHPKMQSIENKKFYIGEIVSQGKSGKRNKKTRPDLDIAEHALILALSPKLNARRTQSNLSDCVSIFSRFFSPLDWEVATNPLPKFPKVVTYNSWSDELLAY